MPTVNKSLIVPYTAAQMYDLINDIEAYPEFLPWCKATEVQSRSLTEVKATIHLAKGPITYSITTINNMQPHERIAMQYIAGPFRQCSGCWEFIPTALGPDQGQHCQVIFTMDYRFTNKLAAITIEPVFKPITNTLIDAFYKRAQDIYAN